MDKSTLSQYGWVVIVIIVIAILLGFSGPFAMFVKDVVFNTTVALGDKIDIPGPGNKPKPQLEYYIGKNSPEYVKATFNEDFTEVVITKNGEDSDGIMKDFETTADKRSPFYNNRQTLKTVIVNEGVTTIGDHAITEISNLKSVSLPEGIVSVGIRSFASNPLLATIDIPSTLKNIGDSAFSGCLKLKNVDFPEGLISIGCLAFFGCESLGNIVIPSTVAEIEFGPFSRCYSMTTITVDKNNPNFISSDGVLYNSNKDTIIQYPAGKTDINYEILNTVKTVGAYSFVENHYIKIVNIPEGVTAINTNSFSMCIALENINIPTSVKNIGHQAFYACRSVNNTISIPANVTSIGTGAFSGAGSSFVVDNNNTSYKTIDDVLVTIDGKTLLAYPAKKTDKTYEIPNGIVVIDEYSLNYAYNLEEIIISDTVTTINRSAFAASPLLVSVTIPESVESIGSQIFYNCPSFSTIKGVADSAAEIFANEHNFTFEPLN